jgi:hypothetical protein
MFREEEYVHSDRLRGFPELFLGQGARGVIAATGYVNDAFAAEVALWLFEKFQTAELPISTLLRNWRREVVNRTSTQRSEQDIVTLLNACMYVYYGNPLARLRLMETT